jgi:parvulin-like peptidyl-prolyl isomerase
MQQVHAIDPSTLERAATQVRVVAQIGTDVVITDDEIWQLVRQDAGAYVRLTGAAREQKEKELFRTALRRVIERELIISEFLGKLRKNKPELIDKVFEDASQSAARQMREFRKRNKVESEEDMARGMRAQGLSYKALLRQLERSAIENMYLSSIIKEEKKKILLSDVERYYQDHPDEFRVEDKVSWNDLFVAYSQFPTEADARRYAEGLLAKLKAGEDFGELAMNYSHGMTKLNKGDGVGEKRGEINPPELEPVVFSLPINQLSDLIPSATGIHIVKVTERIHAGVKPFDERVQTEIKAKLLQQIQEAERAKLIEDLWRKTTVKIAELP